MTVPEIELATGGDNNSSSRYGDYNQMGVDPVDGCTFWFLGMYNPSGKAVRVGGGEVRRLRRRRQRDLQRRLRVRRHVGLEQQRPLSGHHHRLSRERPSGRSLS